MKPSTLGRNGGRGLQVRHFHAAEMWDPEMGVHYYAVMCEDAHFPGLWLVDTRHETKHDAYVAFQARMARERAATA